MLMTIKISSCALFATILIATLALIWAFQALTKKLWLLFPIIPTLTNMADIIVSTHDAWWNHTFFAIFLIIQIIRWITFRAFGRTIAFVTMLRARRTSFIVLTQKVTFGTFQTKVLFSAALSTNLTIWKINLARFAITCSFVEIICFYTIYA